MDELLNDFRSQKFTFDTSTAEKMEECRKKIAQWISSHREKLLLAWWAEHGFGVGSAVLVEERNGGDVSTYIRECTAEEKERAKATANSATLPLLPVLLECRDFLACEPSSRYYREHGLKKKLDAVIAQQ